MRCERRKKVNLIRKSSEINNSKFTWIMRPRNFIRSLLTTLCAPLLFIWQHKKHFPIFLLLHTDFGGLCRFSADSSRKKTFYFHFARVLVACVSGAQSYLFTVKLISLFSASHFSLFRFSFVARADPLFSPIHSTSLFVHFIRLLWHCQEGKHREESISSPFELSEMTKKECSSLIPLLIRLYFTWPNRTLAVFHILLAFYLKLRTFVFFVSLTRSFRLSSTGWHMEWASLSIRPMECQTLVSDLRPRTICKWKMEQLKEFASRKEKWRRRNTADDQFLMWH